MPIATRESWETYRRRMLDETSRYIEWGLKHPDLVIEIPAKPADQGGFAPGAGEWFWGVALSSNPAGRIRRWRDVLLRRPKEFFHRRGRLRPSR